VDIGFWPSDDILDSPAAAWAYAAFSVGSVECVPDARTKRFLAGLPGFRADIEIQEGVRPRSHVARLPVPLGAWVQGGYFVLIQIEAEAAEAFEQLRDLALTCGLVGYSPEFEIALDSLEDWQELRARWDEAEARDAAYWRDERAVPSTYDRLKWHVEAESFPGSQPPEQGFVHIGMYLTWLVLHDLYDPEGLPRKSVEEIKLRHATGCSLQKRLGGNLARERFSLEGTRFADFYYRAEQGYLHDFHETFGTAADEYAVPDSWETYAQIEPVIDRRYADWKSKSVGG
jgi:hypothetical protein